jgi:hypothetical protein
MPPRSYRQRPEVEAQFIDLELRERRFALRCRAVLLVLSIALVLTAILCALRGAAWPAATTASGSGTIIGLLCAIASRNGR